MSAAAPARFDADAQRRRALLGKVHIAAKELNLVGDLYSDVLFGVTGKDSARDCTEAELVAVIERMKVLGWKPAQPKGRTGNSSGPARPRAADHKSAAKARAMWISLYHLGAIDNPSEQALEAFAKRQLGCDRLQFANQRQMFRLIEALKAIAQRNGWDQSTEGLTQSAVPKVLRRRLVDRIVELLKEAGVIPAAWSYRDAAWRLCGIEIDSLLLVSASRLHEVSGALGEKLRAAKARMGDKR